MSGATRIIRLTNLRANASQLPLSTTLIPTAITTTVSDPSLNIFNPAQTVAFMQPGLVVAAETGGFTQCGSHNTSLIGGTGAAAFDFNLLAAERFASSFRRRDIGVTADGPTAPQLFAQNVPGFPYLTESELYAPALFSVGSRAGLADFGMRIQLTFSNVGAGARIFVPTSLQLTTINGSTSTPPTPPAPVPAGIAIGQLQMVQTDQYGNSPSPGYTSVPAVATVQGTPVAEVNYSGSTAYVVYEIVNSDPNVPETATIPVAVAFNVSGSLPALGLVYVNISEAPADGPLAGIPLADATAPIPRFADTSIAQAAYSIIPCTVPISVNTNPSGLQVIVDGVIRTSPQNLNWTPGTTHTIAVTSPQGNSSSSNLFQNWTGGLPQSFQITAPSSAETFTANFSTQYLLTMNAGSGGTVSPPSGWFNAGQTVAISATPAGGSLFTGWTGTGSGSFTGAVNNTSITMNGPVTETASFGLSNGVPSAVSVSPSSGSGSSQTFTFTYSDPNGAADIASAQIDISATLSVSGACYLYYPRGLNEIYLASDAGVWQGPLPLGSSGTLENSQCTVNAGASSASMSGNTLTLNLALSFTAGFAGTKNVYMEVENATHDSGWTQFGTWTVASSVQSSSPPAAVSVSPNSGSGSSGTFTFTYSDSNGATDISSAQIDIASTLSVSGACYLYYPRGLNEIYLASDAGVWQGPLRLGSTGTLQNSQCAVNAGASSASASGNTLTLNLALSFTAGFAGAKNVYMEVENASHDSGWSLMGAWTVP
jgi:hypothetical protein